jgi:hypothetical protein
MTEYELTDLTATAATLVMTAISIYLTIVSAYLIAAFTTGTKLNRSQAFVISTLFVFGSSLFIYAAVVNLLKQIYIIERLVELQAAQPFYFSERSAVLIAIFLISGVIASLKFMWDIRHPKTE